MPDQPDIMAIGDSMYQGIRSMSLLPDAVAWSAPAQVARAIGMRMVLPDLGQPLLWDLEAELRAGTLVELVGRVRDICVENLRHWDFGRPWSDHAAFDNVAVGGAAIEDLWKATAGDHANEAQRLIRILNQPAMDKGTIIETAAELWYALNTCYTLNPRHDAAQARQSQIDQAVRRQPSILLVNIGSNEGLFKAGFQGDLSALDADGDRIPDLMKELGRRLHECGPRTERIVVNTLVRPRFIPNLMPSSFEENEFPEDHYFTAYGPRIFSTHQDISGPDLEAFDKKVKNLNAANADALRAADNRILIADLFASGDAVDGKHYLDRGVRTRDKMLNNRPISGLSHFGGLASLDNMHPTAPGHAVIAETVLASLGRTITLDKQAAYDADTLLNNINIPELMLRQMGLSLLGAAMRLFSGGGAPALTS